MPCCCWITALWAFMTRPIPITEIKSLWGLMKSGWQLGD